MSYCWSYTVNKMDKLSALIELTSYQRRHKVNIIDKNIVCYSLISAEERKIKRGSRMSLEGGLQL